VSLGPSAVADSQPVFVNGEFIANVAPKAMTKDDIKRMIENFRKAAENAKLAGYDGL